MLGSHATLTTVAECCPDQDRRSASGFRSAVHPNHRLARPELRRGRLGDNTLRDARRAE
jgi:hypothetical protein